MEDEEVAESWEEAADSGEIDRRLEKKLKITQKESRKSKSPPKVPIVIQDDSLPTGPPPQIRILKRPTSNGVVSSPNSTSRPALPVKSLAQREAEYAEARKRILGSASPLGLSLLSSVALRLTPQPASLPPHSVDELGVAGATFL
ncbi:SUZ RNA binding domain containing 1 [Phyllostomus discolor]|uniref:SUZ RNA binding domain containing 1 n=1 Tax=Phyllostomus discolor TaxID=89673 RepID=A0A834AGA8_9CHIR|nr:SUZ RNA binding domain containing 1 [Phyllostomus discolor]